MCPDSYLQQPVKKKLIARSLLFLAKFQRKYCKCYESKYIRIYVTLNFLDNM